jgi:hypothetical protein
MGDTSGRSRFVAAGAVSSSGLTVSVIVFSFRCSVDRDELEAVRGLDCIVRRASAGG